MKENKAMVEKFFKNVNFVPKNVQIILSSHKISEKYSFHNYKFHNIHKKTPVLESHFK